MATPTLLLFVLSTLVVANANVPPSNTFTYVNSGEFGPYITEYNADYRLVSIPAPLPFQFCFFNTTPGAFYLGLRMGTLHSESQLRWVWEANRGRPVSENATISLHRDGDLVLADADGTVAWSTGTAGRGVVGVKTLPNGNVVLYDARGRFVWQSFDHPTDTLLVGQSLAAGGTTKLVSRAPDGSFGMYSLVLEAGGLAMYINNITAKPLPYYDIELSNSGAVRSATFESEPETEKEVPFAYELRLSVLDKNSSGISTYIMGRPKYNATLSFLRLEPDGNLVVYTFYDPVDYRAWERAFTLFSDETGQMSGCALPSKCGALGVCEDEMCVACPTPKGLLGWSKGCRPPRAALCGGGKGVDEYYKVVGVENFVSSYVEGERGAVRVEECRRRCSSDCRCVGFMYWEVESKCWLAPMLGTLAKVSNSSHVAYIKL